MRTCCTKLGDAELIRAWRIAFNLLHKHQTKRAFNRLCFIAQLMDNRQI